MEKRSFGRAWTVVFTVFFAGICLAWGQNKVVPLIPVIQAQFQAPLSTVSWLSSIFCIMGVVMAVPSALILQKVGARLCGTFSVLIALVGAVMGAMTDSIPVLLVSRVVEGTGVSLISVTAPALISEWFPVEKRGLPMGIWGSWQMVGQSAVFFLAAGISRSYGWQGVWLTGAGACLMAAILFSLVVRSPKTQVDSGNGAALARFRISWNTCLFGAAGFLFCMGCFGWVTWVVSVWRENLGIQEDVLNRYIAYMFILEIPLVILIGGLFDRFSNWRKPLGIFSAAAYAALLAAGYSMNTTAFLLPYLILYPLFEGAVATWLWTNVPQACKDPSDTPSAVATLTIGMNLAGVAAPPVVNWFREGWGNAVAGICMAVCLALAAAVIGFVKIYEDTVSDA